MRIRTIALLAASAGLCLAMTTLPAVDDQPGTNPTPTQARPMPTFNVEFGGGTVGEYLDELASITPINVVAPNGVRTLPMPAVRLQGVTGNAAVQLVRNMYNFSMDGGVSVSVVEDGSTAPIYVMSLVQRRGEDPDAAPPAVNEIFSVGDVLRPSSDEPTDTQVKKIFEMIDSAMTLAPADAQPDLAFHADTQMLVFRGSPEQRRLIESVLERYNVSWRTQAEEVDRLRRQLAATELEARTSAIEAESARGRVAHLMTRFQELRQLQEAGGVNAGEVRTAEEEANQAHADAQIREARAAYAREQAASIQRQLSGSSAGSETTIVIYDFRGLGGEGDRVGLALKTFLDAAQFPATELTADGSGMVTLRASTALHEVMHELLTHLRSRLDSRRPAAGTR